MLSTRAREHHNYCKAASWELTFLLGGLRGGLFLCFIITYSHQSLFKRILKQPLPVVILF